MSTTATLSPVLEKTLELCEAIVSDPRVNELQDKVERFLGNDAAREQYKAVHEKGEELHHKQHSGVQLGSAEIREFEAAREALFANPVANDFMQAQQELENIQREIKKYVSLTLELGRVPGEEDLEESSGGGCCGGGCGCSH